MAKAVKLDPALFCEQSKELLDFLQSKIINQSRAIYRIVDAFDHFYSPLWKPGKPLFAGLFPGPSGVGKTYMAEVLAEYLFDNPAALTKIECANYRQDHQTSRLIGAPPGYLGYYDPQNPNYRGSNPPLLAQESIDRPAIEYFKERLFRTDKKALALKEEIDKIQKSKIHDPAAIQTVYLLLRQKMNELANYIAEKIKNYPLFSIILFDEIERANSSLFDFILEITDKGRNTLGNGDETVFYNSFIFMTSNLGQKAIADFLKGKRGIGFSSDKAILESQDPIYEGVMSEVRKTFDPAFIGRIEENIVVFEPLSREKLEKIMALEINELITTLSKKYPIEIIIDGAVKNFILEKACDHPEYGARLIKGKINKYLVKPLGRLINSGQLLKGDRVSANLENGEICFIKKNAPSAVKKPVK